MKKQYWAYIIGAILITIVILYAMGVFNNSTATAASTENQSVDDMGYTSAQDFGSALPYTKNKV